ncbi:MAG: hypothetical protein QOF43_2357, partial [Gaiellaceae bacterium]|nr:hypothetical protein [Gaiellaceae bacterium]
YLILDQFEEYFLYHGESPGGLLQGLPDLLRDSRVHVLMSLREDSLARLDAFKARIPDVFGNQVRLDHLDRAAGRAAILGPIRRWNELTDDLVDIEPALVEAVLDDVAADGVEGRALERDRIEAPYLQLVLERIWEAERAVGSPTLRLHTLRELGGATSIVQDHLHGALASLEPDEQDVASSMFEHLVTPSGTKIAHRAPDLAEYAHVPEESLRTVLGELTRNRIVHSIDGSDRYEIFHDVLAEPIRAWRQQRRLERERVAAKRRQRRLYAFTAVTLVALAVVAGLAVWAFTERGSARSQAHEARARALEATALQQLSLDPSKSVRLALSAAQLEPGLDSETVLRESLIADRVRFNAHVGGIVNAVAISPDARLLAVARSGNRVLILDAHRHRVLQTLHAPGGAATLAFQDRAVLISTSPHGVLTAWTVGTGRRESASSRLLGSLAHAAAHITVLVRTPGLVAAAVRERNGHIRARVFDNYGKLLFTLPEIGIKDLDFSPDGKLLATASADGNATEWDTRTGRAVVRIPDSKGGVRKVAFSPDGRLLATGGSDAGVRVYTASTGERLFFLPGHQNAVSALAWSPDGRVLASGSVDRTVRLWGVQGLVEYGTTLAVLAGHVDAVRALGFSPDGRRLATGGDDGTVRVWDARPEEDLRVLPGGRTKAPMIAARWAGNTIAAASEDGTVLLFDGRTRRLTATLSAGSRKVLALALSGDGSLILASAADGTVSTWNRSGRLLDRSKSSRAVQSLAVSKDGRTAVGGDAEGAVRVWDPRTGRIRWSASQRGAVADVAISDAGDVVATASPDGVVVWSGLGRPLHRLPVPRGVVRVAFSPDGRIVGAAANDTTGRLWFVKTGHPYRILRGHHAALTDIAFSTDGALVATSSHDADGRVWNVASGRRVHLFRGHSSNVAAIAFSPNRRWVVTAGPISAGLWPMSDGRILFFLRGHTGVLTSVSFSPDGHTILSSGADGTVRTYTCEVCGTLDTLERLAERRLALGR